MSPNQHFDTAPHQATDQTQTQHDNSLTSQYAHLFSIRERDQGLYASHGPRLATTFGFPRLEPDQENEDPDPRTGSRVFCVCIDLGGRRGSEMGCLSLELNLRHIEEFSGFNRKS
jgi:hypothetical protein